MNNNSNLGRALVYGCQVSSKIVSHFYVEYFAVSPTFSSKKSDSTENFGIFGIKGITYRTVIHDPNVPNT